jgi:hypothetical protein
VLRLREGLRAATGRRRHPAAFRRAGGARGRRGGAAAGDSHKRTPAARHFKLMMKAEF